MEECLGALEGSDGNAARSSGDQTNKHRAPLTLSQLLPLGFHGAPNVVVGHNVDGPALESKMQLELISAVRWWPGNSMRSTRHFVCPHTRLRTLTTRTGRRQRQTSSPWPPAAGLDRFGK